VPDVGLEMRSGRVPRRAGSLLAAAGLFQCRADERKLCAMLLGAGRFC